VTPSATRESGDSTAAIAAGVGAGGAVVVIAAVVGVVIVRRRRAKTTTSPSRQKDGDIPSLFMSQAPTASFLEQHQDALIETVATGTAYDPPTIGGHMEDIDDDEW
jgi:hypothetical protein